MSNLPLQMLFYFNGFYFVTWAIGSGVILQVKVSC